MQCDTSSDNRLRIKETPRRPFMAVSRELDIDINYPQTPNKAEGLPGGIRRDNPPGDKTHSSRHLKAKRECPSRGIDTTLPLHLVLERFSGTSVIYVMINCPGRSVMLYGGSGSGFYCSSVFLSPWA